MLTARKSGTLGGVIGGGKNTGNQSAGGYPGRINSGQDWDPMTTQIDQQSLNDRSHVYRICKSSKGLALEFN